MLVCLFRHLLRFVPSVRTSSCPLWITPALSSPQCSKVIGWDCTGESIRSLQSHRFVLLIRLKGPFWRFSTISPSIRISDVMWKTTTVVFNIVCVSVTQHQHCHVTHTVTELSQETTTAVFCSGAVKDGNMWVSRNTPVCYANREKQTLKHNTTKYLKLSAYLKEN